MKIYHIGLFITLMLSTLHGLPISSTSTNHPQENGHNITKRTIFGTSSFLPDLLNIGQTNFFSILPSFTKNTSIMGRLLPPIAKAIVTGVSTAFRNGAGLYRIRPIVYTSPSVRTTSKQISANYGAPVVLPSISLRTGLSGQVASSYGVPAPTYGAPNDLNTPTSLTNVAGLPVFTNTAQTTDSGTNSFNTDVIFNPDAHSIQKRSPEVIDPINRSNISIDSAYSKVSYETTIDHNHQISKRQVNFPEYGPPAGTSNSASSSFITGLSSFFNTRPELYQIRPIIFNIPPANKMNTVHIVQSLSNILNNKSKTVSSQTSFNVSSEDYEDSYHINSFRKGEATDSHTSGEANGLHYSTLKHTSKEESTHQITPEELKQDKNMKKRDYPNKFVEKIVLVPQQEYRITLVQPNQPEEEADIIIKDNEDSYLKYFTGRHMHAPIYEYYVEESGEDNNQETADFENIGDQQAPIYDYTAEIYQDFPEKVTPEEEENHLNEQYINIWEELSPHESNQQTYEDDTKQETEKIEEQISRTVETPQETFENVGHLMAPVYDHFSEIYQESPTEESITTEKITNIHEDTKEEGRGDVPENINEFMPPIYDYFSEVYHDPTEESIQDVVGRSKFIEPPELLSKLPSKPHQDTDRKNRKLQQDIKDGFEEVPFYISGHQYSENLTSNGNLYVVPNLKEAISFNSIPELTHEVFNNNEFASTISLSPITDFSSAHQEDHRTIKKGQIDEFKYLSQIPLDNSYFDKNSGLFQNSYGVPLLTIRRR